MCIPKRDLSNIHLTCNPAASIEMSCHLAATAADTVAAATAGEQDCVSFGWCVCCFATRSKQLVFVCCHAAAMELAA